MFGPIASKHLRITDPFNAEPGPAISQAGFQLVVPYKMHNYIVRSRGDSAWEGGIAAGKLVLGISLIGAKFHLAMGYSIEGPADGTDVGHLAVVNGVIAVAVSLWPNGIGRGQNHLMMVDVSTGYPVPLGGADDAVWFGDWTIHASFDGGKPFPVMSSDD